MDGIEKSLTYVIIISCFINSDIFCIVFCICTMKEIIKFYSSHLKGTLIKLIIFIVLYP